MIKFEGHLTGTCIMSLCSLHSFFFFFNYYSKQNTTYNISYKSLTLQYSFTFTFFNRCKGKKRKEAKVSLKQNKEQCITGH